MVKIRKRHSRSIGKYLLVVILLLTALGLVLYPFISNYIYENRADGIIETIEKAAESETGSSGYDDDIVAARQYNESLLDGHMQLKDPFIEDAKDEQTVKYKSLLNMTDDGVMGFIKIPCINVSLPIYHGTSAETLEKGAGHLQGTSLPVGGESTHSVITGHTGLSKAKMFTDLTELEIGDIFFLKVMGLNLAYKVDNISVVEPADISKLSIERGQDLCTLVTCTPYGVNTHRLLVRGHRVNYEEAKKAPEVFAKKKTESKWMKEYTKSIIISAICFASLMIGLFIYRYGTGKRRRRKVKKKSRDPNKIG